MFDILKYKTLDQIKDIVIAAIRIKDGVNIFRGIEEFKFNKGAIYVSFGSDYCYTLA